MDKLTAGPRPLDGVAVLVRATTIAGPFSQPSVVRIWRRRSVMLLQNTSR